MNPGRIRTLSLLHKRQSVGFLSNQRCKPFQAGNSGYAVLLYPSYNHLRQDAINTLEKDNIRMKGDTSRDGVCHVHRMPRVKICCIQTTAEAETAIACGASAVGLVSHMPSGPGVIPEEDIVKIAKSIPPPIATFLLTSSQRVEKIIAQQRRCCTNTIQLCDRLVNGHHETLRQALPGISLVQVIHVEDRHAVEAAISVSPYVDALLLDSGKPSLPRKELGGTGRTHDWRLSKEIREAVDVPIFLAGGLHAGNITAAVQFVEPFGVDLCSGVRTDGKLDPAKLKAFFTNLETTYRFLGG